MTSAMAGITPTTYLSRPGQCLVDHLRGVGMAMGEIAYQQTQNETVRDLAYLIGFCHDLGKCNPIWQRVKIQGASAAGIAPEKLYHAVHGASYLIGKLGSDHTLAQLLGNIIRGHHGRLLDHCTTDGSNAQISVAVTERLPDIIRSIPADIQAELDVLLLWPDVKTISALTWLVGPNYAATGDFPMGYSLRLRWLFSLLIQCDRTDAENSERSAHNLALVPSSGNIVLNGEPVTIRNISEAVTAHLDSFGVPTGIVNVWRSRFRLELIQFADRYRSMLPSDRPRIINVRGCCGIGKTLSVLELASTIASIKSGDRTKQQQAARVIYAAPYCAILDQTARVYRNLIDSSSNIDNLRDALTTHYSSADNTDPLKLVPRWQRPLVVTTTVQLIESLFGNKGTRVRKLANIAGSVIILDETQVLPTELLKPIMVTLKTLADDFNCTLIFATATQPDYSQFGVVPAEVITDPDSYYHALTRVTYEQLGELSWLELSSEIANEMERTGYCQALICNQTVKAVKECAAELARAFPTATIHQLTGDMPMCHREIVLNDFKAALALGNREMILVASPCIEAGVDIDSPIGFRQLGPLDSIVQFAGRVNREGNRPSADAKVCIFETKKSYGLPPGDTKQRINITAGLLPTTDLNSANVLGMYTRAVYANAGAKGTDKPGVFEMLCHHFPAFDSAAKAMEMVGPTETVYVCPFLSMSGEFEDAIAHCDWRTLKHFSVNVYPQRFEKLIGSGLIETTADNLHIWRGQYNYGLCDTMALSPATLLA